MAQAQFHPYNRAVAIVPSATINYDGSTYSANPPGGYDPVPAEAIYVGGAGIVEAVFENGSVASFTCVAGQILPIKTIRVNATSTGTLLNALYTV